jgi:hypothetical protein
MSGRWSAILTGRPEPCGRPRPLAPGQSWTVPFAAEAAADEGRDQPDVLAAECTRILAEVAGAGEFSCWIAGPAGHPVSPSQVGRSWRAAPSLRGPGPARCTSGRPSYPEHCAKACRRSLRPDVVGRSAEGLPAGATGAAVLSCGSRSNCPFGRARSRTRISEARRCASLLEGLGDDHGDRLVVSGRPPGAASMRWT